MSFEKVSVRKPRAVRKAAPVESPRELGTSLRTLKRKVEESLDQLALIQGVLEELCERQEALATWQMEYAKRTLSLGEAQWQSLREFNRRAQAGLGPMSERAESHRLREAKAGFEDSLAEATESLGDLSGELSRRREVRRKVMDDRAEARETGSRAKRSKSGSKSRDAAAQETEDASSEQAESILVLPEKTDFH